MLRGATFQEAETLGVTTCMVQAHHPSSSKAFEGLRVSQTHLWLRAAVEDWHKVPANTEGDQRCRAKARQRHRGCLPRPLHPGQVPKLQVLLRFQGAGSQEEGGRWGLSGPELRGQVTRERSREGGLCGAGAEGGRLSPASGNGERRAFTPAPSSQGLLLRTRAITGKCPPLRGQGELGSHNLSYVLLHWKDSLRMPKS